MIQVTSAFDSGAITVLDAGNAADIRLALRPDICADFSQWFYFRVSGVRNTDLRLHLDKVAKSTYPAGWPGYRAVASYDQQNWFRVDSEFDGASLIVRHHSTADLVWFAYFEPYPMDRHAGLLARCQGWPGVQVRTLGLSCAARPIDVVEAGPLDPQLPQVWVICRQHPGESMAEWFAEGMLERLADRADPIVTQLLRGARLHIVPNMNPDGTALGNLRTNAKGIDLNRAWINPSPESSPEVFVVRNAILASGATIFLDVHGDEALPYIFLASSQAQPYFTAAHRQREQQFMAALLDLSPDFQTVHGYPPAAFRPETLAMASQWVANKFECLSFTVEMPFKDNANLPDALVGWNGARSKRLGAAMVGAIHRALVLSPNSRAGQAPG
jgi:murein tripeptide amidase MpaA